MPTYSSLKGVSNKTINKIYENITKNIPDVPEWHRDIVIQNNDWSSFKDSLIQLHNPKKIEDINKNSLAYERISFDEIFSNLLIFSQIKKKTYLFIKNLKFSLRNIN